MSTPLSEKDQFLLDSIRKDDLKAVRSAIDNGANVNFRGSCNRTPLYYAASIARSAIVQVLLDEKADPNLDDDDGLTPLHVAVIEKKFTQAETLIEGGANIDFQFEKKATPLHSAFFADLQNDETVRSEFMVRKGADITATMQRRIGEWTVFEIAREQAPMFLHAETIMQAMFKHLDTIEKAEETAKVTEQKSEIMQAEDVISLVRNSSRQSPKKYRL